jgi:hypothetical protein
MEKYLVQVYRAFGTWITVGQWETLRAARRDKTFREIDFSASRYRILKQTTTVVTEEVIDGCCDCTDSADASLERKPLATTPPAQRVGEGISTANVVH